MSRDGARVAFKQLEAIAKIDHIPGRGWYGLRRQAADMAETATNDDRVKDRLGGWQDSETRKSIYQDRETDELRAQAASVRRQLRIGRGLNVLTDIKGPPQIAPATSTLSETDVEELWESLTPSQRQLLRAKLKA